MLLRDEHFAARRVNWTAKPDNLVSLAEELNLGLESFIFVDDSDHECAAVRHALPQVEVIQVPARAVDVPSCLDHVARLEVLSLTREDSAKTAMYAQERRRRELLQSAAASTDSGDYLERLGMSMTIAIDVADHVPRLAQLTQKTNQFNLSTRRYDESQVRAWVADPRWWVADFSLADAFGDSGIVGLVLLRLDTPRSAHVDTFLMSCRVIGRKAEQAFLHALMRRLVAAGVEEISADFRSTAKNDLVKDFLPSQQFEPAGEGRWRRDLRQTPPLPESEFPIRVHIDPSA
jgi:FkbH-like protein